MEQPVTSYLTRLPKRRPRTVLLAVLFAVALVFGTFSLAPAAHAKATVPDGSNGQQLLLETILAYSVYVEGYNQNNVYVAHCFPTPTIYNYATGWWWKSTQNSAVYTTSFPSNNCSGKVLNSSKLGGPCFIAWNVPVQYNHNYYPINLDYYDC